MKTSNTIIDSTLECNTFRTIPKYGTTPAIVHHIAANEFSIKDNFRHCFSNYFLLYWKSQYFLSQCHQGTILKDGIRYVVIYGENTSRGKLIQSPEREVALSFRNPKPEFGIPAYVIISFSRNYGV